MDPSPSLDDETLTDAEQHARVTHRLARLTLGAFVFTFLTSRILVILIMSGRMPGFFFLHVKGTHVHHLNYGISLLSVVGGYLLFARPVGRRLSVAAAIYGLGLALTFDEFGMWLHLGGSYWQRASYDSIVLITAILALLAYAYKLKRLRAHHWYTAVAIVLVSVVFLVLLFRSAARFTERVTPSLMDMEDRGPG
jgi:hypothetical protein